MAHCGWESRNDGAQPVRDAALRGRAGRRRFRGGARPCLPRAGRGRPGRAALVEGHTAIAAIPRYASLNDLPLSRPDFRRAGEAAQQACRGLRGRVCVRSGRAQAEARQLLGERAQAGRYPFRPYPPAQRGLGHGLYRGTAGCRAAQAGGSAPAADDGRADKARRRAGGFAQLRLCRARNAGSVLLWESWLRHEVPAGTAKDERISISFNYR